MKEIGRELLERRKALRVFLPKCHHYRLFLLSGIFILLFRFGEDKGRVVVTVESDKGIKVLALLALEAFKEFRLSGGEQFLDFIIGEKAARFQAEDG